MKAVYKATGKNLFKTGMPPHETVYDKDKFHDELVEAMEHDGLFGFAVMELMRQYGIDKLECYLVEGYKVKELRNA